MKKPKLLIAPCSRTAAKHACENWHYSKCMPTAGLFHLGVWEDEQFIGTVIFGMGATPKLGRFLNLRQFECCELVRIALNEHVTPVTRIMAISIKLFQSANPNTKAIVSYADRNQGHEGKIYQAGNWIRTGISYAKHIRYNGKVVHPRSIYAKFGTCDCKNLNQFGLGVSMVETIGKIRYVYPLCDEVRLRAKHLNDALPDQDR